ncbi:hypothetical protein LCGC14_1127650 [marine sediment metagenome]|uniref:Uncharacterized protein n=1 Tax=marine sediment metagenome TaxID=412755 RepID=A0A0F9M6U9_9ZZZZ
MTIRKKPHAGKYPSAATHLMNEGFTTPPRQYEKTFKKTQGVEIVYKLQDMTPVVFRENSDYLLLLAYQEAMRYEEHDWKFAEFDVRLGRLRKGRDLPEIVTFTAAMNPNSEIMVYGPGYEVPQRHFLYNKVEDILDIVRRYPGRVNKQTPYKVVALRIKIRDEI